MKKVYYLCHCGSGTSVFMDLIELVREEGDKLIFHINDYDTDLMKRRTITLKGYRVKRYNAYNEPYTKIDFNSSKEQYKYHFIREVEIEDSEEPKKHIIEY